MAEGKSCPAKQKGEVGLFSSGSFINLPTVSSGWKDRGQGSGTSYHPQAGSAQAAFSHGAEGRPLPSQSQPHIPTASPAPAVLQADGARPRAHSANLCPTAAALQVQSQGPALTVLPQGTSAASIRGHLPSLEPHQLLRRLHQPHTALACPTGVRAPGPEGSKKQSPGKRL